MKNQEYLKLSKDYQEVVAEKNDDMAKNYESNGSLEGKLERLERDCQKKDVKIELLEE